MYDDSEASVSNRWIAVAGALRPAVPAVIGAAALTFLFAAVMPMAWVAGISWNLYLDRLSELFVPPVGEAARLALAFGMAAIAALIAGFIALVIARPEDSGLAALRRRVRRRSEEGEDDVPVRRRADAHPDDLPRAPLRAGRDLPAEGLVPPPMEIAVAAPPYSMPETGWGEAEEDELILADLAPVEVDEPGTEPWLQPVEATGSALPDPSDGSLSAMVARFEAGLTRRHQGRAATPAIPVPDMAPTDEGDEAEIDFALEAALSTLQRMNRQAAG